MGDELHTNMHQFALPSCGFFEPILVSAKAKVRELVQRCLGFSTIEVSHVSHEPFATQPVIRQITDSSNAMIKSEIPLLGAGASLVDDDHGLGNLPHALPHSIIYPLCH